MRAPLLNPPKKNYPLCARIPPLPPPIHPRPHQDERESDQIAPGNPHVETSNVIDEQMGGSISPLQMNISDQVSVYGECRQAEIVV